MDYNLKKRVYELHQSSIVTCWAACAAMLKSYERGSYMVEREVLLGKYLNLFNNESILPFDSVIDFFETTMNFKTESWDPAAAYSTTTWQKLMDSYGPLIVPAPVLDTRSVHIRVMHGIWGTGNSDEGTQFKVFDPWRCNTLNDTLMILYPHIVYQLSASVPLIGRPNIIWHL